VACGFGWPQAEVAVWLQLTSGYIAKFFISLLNKIFYNFLTPDRFGEIGTKSTGGRPATDPRSRKAASWKSVAAKSKSFRTLKRFFRPSGPRLSRKLLQSFSTLISASFAENRVAQTENC
jgi:hypothetical protein